MVVSLTNGYKILYTLGKPCVIWQCCNSLAQLYNFDDLCFLSLTCHTVADLGWFLGFHGTPFGVDLVLRKH